MLILDSVHININGLFHFTAIADTILTAHPTLATTFLRYYQQFIIMNDYPTTDKLKEALQTAGIDTAQWGHGNAKTIENLWHELQEGDCQLITSPNGQLQRQVRVVQLFIEREGRVLIEARQQLVGGRWRERNLLPAEKLKPEESYQQGALRCLHEEFGISAPHIRFDDVPHQINRRIEESHSYPTLLTRYELNLIAFDVPSLPNSHFQIVNKTNANDPVLAHWWEWRENSDAVYSTPS